MRMWSVPGAMVEVELISANVEETLEKITQSGIELKQIHFLDGLTVRFLLSGRDWGCLQKRQDDGTKVRLLSRHDRYWAFRALWHRKVLVGGLSLLTLLVLFLPTRVLFVRVDGNVSLPDQKILEAAAECGISFGASRRQVRSENMKNKLLQLLPQLRWAGVNTEGCVAVISVREGEILEEPVRQEGVSSIVAERDGVILSCIATRGDLKCIPGQAVQAGEVLISGYTDCGLTVTGTKAEGEIYAQTSRQLTMFAPEQCLVRCSSGKSTRKFSLIFGKKRINFYKGSGIWDTSCVKIESEYHLTLPGGFQLPVTLVMQCMTDWSVAEGTVSQEDAFLCDAAARYLQRTMVAGSIQSSDQQLYRSDGCLVLAGEYACCEMIGISQQEIGAYNGKTS